MAEYVDCEEFFAIIEKSILIKGCVLQMLQSIKNENSPSHDCGDYLISSNTLYRYIGAEEYIRIPSYVSVIGGRKTLGRTYDANSDRYIFPVADGAFTGLKHLKGVTLPSSLKEIGEGAFWGCSGLQSIDIPNGVTDIPANAFRDCTALQKVTLPDSLLVIGDNAFDNCTSLRKLVLPPKLRAIGSRAFSYCTTLETLVIPDDVEDIGSALCEGCRNLSDIQFSANLSNQLFQGSMWYVDRMTAAARCPVCGEKLSSDNNICKNLNCPTNYGKWER